MVPAARELGVTLVPYSPLGRGFLTGSFANADQDLTDGRLPPSRSPASPARTRRRTRPCWTRSATVAEAHGASLGQIALAWVQQQAGVHGLPVVPIPGTRKPGRVEENAAATAIELTRRGAGPRWSRSRRKVAGDRYADMRFASAGRE